MIEFSDKELQTIYIALASLSHRMNTSDPSKFDDVHFDNWLRNLPFRPALTVEEIYSLTKRIGRENDPYAMKDYLNE